MRTQPTYILPTSVSLKRPLLVLCLKAILQEKKEQERDFGREKSKRRRKSDPSSCSQGSPQLFSVLVEVKHLRRSFRRVNHVYRALVVKSSKTISRAFSLHDLRQILIPLAFDLIFTLLDTLVKICFDWFSHVGCSV